MQYLLFDGVVVDNLVIVILTTKIAATTLPRLRRHRHQWKGERHQRSSTDLVDDDALLTRGLGDKTENVKTGDRSGILRDWWPDAERR